ncbi:hypothetical protein TNCV_207491 [Trichonephila clavipes]|nr:hypothetical protein TNCV_207491 [Trichonephila clavipes]
MRVIFIMYQDPIKERTQLSHMRPKITEIMELFRTIGSTNQKLSTSSMKIPQSLHIYLQIWDGGSLREPYARL